MLRSLHSSATYSTSHLSRGGYSTEPMLEQKVAVIGASNKLDCTNPFASNEAKTNPL
ncbi:hypothetical protein GYH30_033818 [Glycine max]|nr:hypothetical protein GYH30_033818 [Glycine max]